MGMGLQLHLHHSLFPSRTQTEYRLHLSYKNMYVFSTTLVPTQMQQVNSTQLQQGA